MDAIARYDEAFKALYSSRSNGAIKLKTAFDALEQFNAEDRKVIAGRLHEVFEFHFSSLGAERLIRDTLKSLSPDADLSWIPGWRNDNKTLLAST